MGLFSWLVGKTPDEEDEEIEDNYKDIGCIRPEEYDKEIKKHQKNVRGWIQVNKTNLKIVEIKLNSNGRYGTVTAMSKYTRLISPVRSELLKGLDLKVGDTVEITIKKIGK